VTARVLAIPLALMAFHTSVSPLPPTLRAELNGRYWHAGCPVALSGLRVLTVTHWGFDGREHTGQLVVDETAARPLQRVFARLYELGGFRLRAPVAPIRKVLLVVIQCRHVSSRRSCGDLKVSAYPHWSPTPALVAGGLQASGLPTGSSSQP
jgi:hypothetical protein